jgi:hypothetical protein
MNGSRGECITGRQLVLPILWREFSPCLGLGASQEFRLPAGSHAAGLLDISRRIRHGRNTSACVPESSPQCRDSFIRYQHVLERFHGRRIRDHQSPMPPTVRACRLCRLQRCDLRHMQPNGDIWHLKPCLSDN